MAQTSSLGMSPSSSRCAAVHISRTGFPFRSDLKRLMTESLTDASLPELTGLDQFRRAVNPRGLDELYYRPMADLISADRPDSVLDYGCGDGRLAEELAARGIHVTGYDPDSSMISKCMDREDRRPVETGNCWKASWQRASSSTWWSAAGCSAPSPTKRSSVTCSPILRRLVSDSGTVLVAVCNPFHLFTESTELWQKRLPAGFEYKDTFVYDKTVSDQREHQARGAPQPFYLPPGLHQCWISR